MKRSERSSRYRLLAAWRTLLANANHLAANVDDAEELAGIAEVRDYIIDQIEACEASLIIGKHTPRNERFTRPDNAPHNGVTQGLNNG